MPFASCTEPPYHNASITISGDTHMITTTQCPLYTKGWTNPNNACLHGLEDIHAASRAKLCKGTHLSWRSFGVVLGHSVPKTRTRTFGSLGLLLEMVSMCMDCSPCGFSSVCPDADPSAPSNYVDAIESEGHTTDR